jgi:hypothetical protein
MNSRENMEPLIVGHLQEREAFRHLSGQEALIYHMEGVFSTIKMRVGV